MAIACARDRTDDTCRDRDILPRAVDSRESRGGSGSGLRSSRINAEQKALLDQFGRGGTRENAVTYHRYSGGAACAHRAWCVQRLGRALTRVLLLRRRASYLEADDEGDDEEGGSEGEENAYGDDGGDGGGGDGDETTTIVLDHAGGGGGGGQSESLSGAQRVLAVHMK